MAFWLLFHRMKINYFINGAPSIMFFSWILFSDLYFSLFHTYITYRVSQKMLILVFLLFVCFYSSKLQKLEEFLKNSGNLVHATRNRNIWETVATCNIEITFLCLCNSKITISRWRVPTLPQLSQLFLNGFKRLLCLSCSKLPEFFKTPQTFAV